MKPARDRTPACSTRAGVAADVRGHAGGLVDVTRREDERLQERADGTRRELARLLADAPERPLVSVGLLPSDV